MAPNVGSSPRRIHRRISGYVPADGTQVTEPQASKMWNYFFPGPLHRRSHLDASEQDPSQWPSLLSWNNGDLFHVDVLFRCRVGKIATRR
jgi:hypothetical protein